MPHFDGQICGPGDTDIFFPPSEQMVSAVRAAKEICRQCPARIECRDWAVETNQAYGIWGGTTWEERRRIRRNRVVFRRTGT